MFRELAKMCLLFQLDVYTLKKMITGKDYSQKKDQVRTAINIIRET